MHHCSKVLFPVYRQSLRRSTVHNVRVQLEEAVCYYSKEAARRKTFLSRIYDNLKQEFSKNKEMQESLRKFRDEAEKLEQSEALRAARQKFEAVEKEASKGSEVFKEGISTIKTKVQDAIEEAGKSDIAKKAGKISEGFGRTTHTISEKAQEIGKSGAFQTLSQATEAVKKEIDTQSIQGRVYVSPTKLRKRSEMGSINVNKLYEPNTDATGVELHKDSKFYQSWQNFKDNNAYVHKIMDWKLKYDESDNPLIRASRLVTDKVTDVVGGLFQKTELSETLTEICKIDNNFTQKQFLRQCESDIIPNILEAMTRGELEILKDWCHEGPYNVFAVPFKEARKKGYKIESRILDIDNVDIVMGKVMEQGPVLIITFTSQQMMCVKDEKGQVIEGDPEKVMRVSYVWVLCRDPTEPDPRAAWRLLDISASSSEQLV